MNKVQKVRRGRKLCAEFHADARKAVIEYVKELHPKTWFLHLFFSFAWIDGSWVSYFKYTPYWGDNNHWFFKKWDFSRSFWHSDYFGFLKDDPSIRFEFHAWLCFRRGF